MKRLIFTITLLVAIFAGVDAQADTRRLLSALQTLLADNVSGDISPQDLRDAIISSYPADNFEDVKNHGAAGDGVADDQPEVQAAIDAAGVGGVVYFPPGTYLLTAGKLTVSTNKTTLILDRGAEVKLNNNIEMILISGDDVSVFGGFWNANGAQTGAKNLFEVTGDKFLLENAVLSGGNNTHINLHGSSDSIIRGNRITANVFSAIFVRGRTGPVNARNNLIQGNYIFQTGGTDSDAVQGHSSVSGSDIDGLRIVDNYMEMGSGDFHVEVGSFGGERPRGIVIANNRFVSTATLFGALSIAATDDSVVSGNMIDLVGFGVTIGGIEVVNAKRIIVDGNIIKQDSSGEHGIIIDGGTIESNDNIISNNIIEGFDNGTAANTAGITIEVSQSSSAKRNLITGNVIRFPTVLNAGVLYSGIVVISNNAGANIVDTVISNNMIFGNGDTAIDGIGITEFSGTLDRTMVIDNIIIDTDDGIRLSTSSANSIVRDNRFVSVTTELPAAGAASNIYLEIKQTKAQTFAVNDTTPDISGGILFRTNNSSGTLVSALDGGRDGDVVRIIIDDGNTDFDFTATTLKGNGGVNWTTSAADDMITCSRAATNWYCDIVE